MGTDKPTRAEYEQHIKQLTERVEQQDAEIKKLLENNAQLSVAFVGTKLWQLRTEYEHDRSRWKKQIEEITDRLDRASVEVGKLKKQIASTNGSKMDG